MAVIELVLEPVNPKPKKRSSKPAVQAVSEAAVSSNMAPSESLEDADPRGFEIDTNGARRVVLEVTFGGDGDVGDNIRFLSPRLLK